MLALPLFLFLQYLSFFSSLSVLLPDDEMRGARWFRRKRGMFTFSNLGISLSLPLLGFFQLLHLLHVLPVHSPVIQLVDLDVAFSFCGDPRSQKNKYGSRKSLDYCVVGSGRTFDFEPLIFQWVYRVLLWCWYLFDSVHYTLRRKLSAHAKRLVALVDSDSSGPGGRWWCRVHPLWLRRASIGLS